MMKMKPMAISLVLMGLMAASVGAGKKAEVPATPAPALQTVVAEATAVPAAAATAAVNNGKAAQALAEAQEAIGNLTADFALQVPGAGQDGGPFAAHGKMWVAAGRRYVVAYEEPEKQRLVSDGKKRWLYLEKINQVQVQSLPPAGNPNEFFLELGGGLPALIQQCDVDFLPKDEQHPDWEGFILVPKAGSGLAFEQAKMWLAGKQLAPRRVVVKAGRNVRVDFSNVQVQTLEALLRDPEKNLDDNLFEFQVPKGAEVIEMF